DREGPLKWRPARPATPEVEQGVTEIEGRVASRKASYRRVPHRLLQEGQGTCVLMRLHEREARVVECACVLALEQKLVERDRLRCRGRRFRSLGTTFSVRHQCVDAERDRRAEQRRKDEQRQR